MSAKAWLIKRDAVRVRIPPGINARVKQQLAHAKPKRMNFATSSTAKSICRSQYHVPSRSSVDLLAGSDATYIHTTVIFLRDYVRCIADVRRLCYRVALTTSRKLENSCLAQDLFTRLCLLTKTVLTRKRMLLRRKSCWQSQRKQLQTTTNSLLCRLQRPSDRKKRYVIEQRHIFPS